MLVSNGTQHGTGGLQSKAEERDVHSARLPVYPTYKPSGVEWLGDLPEHWEVRRLKQVCSRYSLYGANIAASRYEDEGVRFLRTTDISEDGRLLEGGGVST